MKAAEARLVGTQVSGHLSRGDLAAAYGLLGPVLARRTPFRLLGEIGAALGSPAVDRDWEKLGAFLDQVAFHATEGGWVVIGAALGQRLGCDLEGALHRSRTYVRAGGVWYAADILSERVPGPALVNRFQPALEALRPWRDDPDRWVRRAVGVAVHFWAKWSQGSETLASRASALLSFLAPMFTEWEPDAVKGVGWGLKTLGRHYPELVTQWLAEEIVPQTRRHRALMLRKALTYLSAEQRSRAVGETSA